MNPFTAANNGDSYWWQNQRKDLYSAFEKSKRTETIEAAAFEYLGREPKVGDVVSIWVHSGIMNKSFLKTFEVN
jgi:hypothetical protein